MRPRFLSHQPLDGSAGEQQPKHMEGRPNKDRTILNLRRRVLIHIHSLVRSVHLGVWSVQ